jgi:hypothetical protein
MATDYSDIGLNQFLQPNNAPVSADSTYVDNLKFDANFDIPAGRINYTNMSPASRAYTAVISLSRENGTFDDIQEAINYVNRQGGGSILVLEGTYVISNPLTLYSNIQLIGLGRAICVFDFNSTTNSISTTSESEDIKIDNLTFNNSTNTTGAISISLGTRIRISNCGFNNNTLDIYSSASIDVVVEDCTSGVTTGSGTFYSSPSVTGLNVISRNNIFSTTSYVFKNFPGHNIQNNFISTVGTTVFYGTANNAFISGNILSTPPKYACDLQNSAEVRISDNDFVAALLLGTVSNSAVSNNVLTSFSGSTPVIKVAGGGTTSFTGNRLTAGAPVASVDGISFVGAADCLVTGNYIRTNNATSGYAINIDAASSRVAVVGNRLQGQTGATNDLGTGDVIASNS